MRPKHVASESSQSLTEYEHQEESDGENRRPFDGHEIGNHNEVISFTNAYGLQRQHELFVRASLIVQSDIPAASNSAITPQEVAILNAESAHKWRQPWTMYLTIVVTALGAMGQGWAQTAMNGANLYFPQEFGIGSKSAHDNLILGFINSGIYLSNGLLGAWLVAPLNDRLGRKGAVFGATLVSMLTNIGGALSQNWIQLLFFRLALGCALGVISSTLNVFAAECAPANIRGALAVSWQAFCAFGIFVGFVTNVAVYDFGPNTWRLQLAAPFLSTIPLLILICMCPESPAWYLKHGQRYDRAYRSLTRLRNTELKAARELWLAYLQRKRSITSQVLPSYFRSLVELFTIPRIRRAMLASYSTMIAQQLCGINIIAFYSSTIFAEADFSTFGALMASVVFGFVNFVGAFPAVWTMDTLGRRSLLLVTLPFMALTMLIAGLSFSIPNENSAHFGLLATMIYLFCAEYSPGMGPVPAAYSAEVFPLSHREIGMSSAVAVTNLWASALSLTFPALLSLLGSQGAFTLYAALNVAAFVLVFLFVPETKLKTLDELDEVFSVSTTKFMSYQLFEYIPWWFRHYILRQHKAELVPLVNTEQYERLDQDED